MISILHLPPTEPLQHSCEVSVAQAMVIPLTFWESLKHSTHAPAPRITFAALPLPLPAVLSLGICIPCSLALSLSGFCSNVSETFPTPPALLV